MNKIFLHVGLPKTGTTDLQDRLNRIDSQGHRSFLHSLPNDLIQPGLSRRVHLLHDVFMSADREQSEKLLALFCKWISQGEDLTRVYCSELLTQTPRFSISRIREIFLELSAYAEVHIVVVLRPYFSWLESFISQSVKKGSAIFAESKSNPKDYLRSWELNFQKLLDFYEESLPNGGKYIHVLPFSRKVNDEIAALAGINLPSALTGAANVSPSAYEALQAFAHIKRLDSTFLPQDRTLRFIGRRQIESVRSEIATWVDPLAGRLGWPRDWLDDGDRALETAPPVSYLDLMAKAAPFYRAVSGRRADRHDRADVASSEGLDGAYPQDDRSDVNMAETIQLEDQQVVYALSRIFARTALIETGAETPAPDDVTAEWQRDKASYQKQAHHFLRALDRAGYMIERKAN